MRCRKFTNLLFLLTYDQECRFSVSFHLFLSPKKQKGLIREKDVISTKDVKSINFLDSSPAQMLSHVISSVPFLEHNDPNRMLMSSTMQRQSLALTIKEVPLIQTMFDFKVIYNSSLLSFSDSAGYVKYLSWFKMIFSRELLKFSWFLNAFKKNWLFYKDKYYSFKKERSNQDTYVHSNFLQIKNNWFRSTSLLSDITSTYLGKLSFGKNFLVGYVCWDGYNFEDAVVINEIIIKKELLSSLYLKKYRFFITDSSFDKV